jgi:hypothetical protein
MQTMPAELDLEQRPAPGTRNPKSTGNSIISLVLYIEQLENKYLQ